MPIEVTADLVLGAGELEPTPRGLRPHRLPRRVRQRFPDPQLLAMQGQPSGVRLVLATAATRLELTTHPARVSYVGAVRPRGSIDVRVDGGLLLSDTLTGGDVDEVDLRSGTVVHHDGPAHRTVVEGLAAGDKHVEIWLPHDEAADVVALSADAAVRPVAARAPVWVHHGSSISQGSGAASPSRTWPAVAARRLGLDLRNLGVGGSALVDPFMARVIRDSPADLISLKLGINVVNVDGMRVRTLAAAVHGFLDTVRDGHPDTPLLLVSPLYCGIHEHTPGPAAIDPTSLGTDQVRFTATGREGDTDLGRLTLAVVREVLADVVGRRGDDENLHHLDGTRLYGEADASVLPLPDGLHPDAATHRLVGDRFADQVLSSGGEQGRRPWLVPA